MINNSYIVHLQLKQKMICPICHEAISTTTGIATLSCSHSFHINCIGKWFSSLDEGTCPCCRKKMSALEDLPTSFKKENEDILTIYNDAAERLAVDIAEAVAEAMAEEAEEAEKKRKAKNRGFIAFIKHCKDTIPEIAAISRVSEQIRLANELKRSDRAGYKKFITEWNAVQNIMV